MESYIQLKDGQRIEISDETAKNILDSQKPKKKVWVAISKYNNKIDRILVRLPRDVLECVDVNDYDFKNDEIVVSFAPQKWTSRRKS